MEKEGQGMGIAIAIVIAVSIVAGAIFYSNSQNTEIATSEPWTREITNTGKHVLGNVTAPIIITEYSDTECPFCHTFHDTMKKIMNRYGTNGDVAWMYKHFPLDNIHKEARNEAEAAECIAELSGNETFWKFLDAMFTSQSTPTRALETAIKLGIDQNLYTLCLENEVFADLVDKQYKEGIRRGVKGTPHNIINTSDGQEFVISGAYPFEALSLIIEMILADKDATVIQGFIDLISSRPTAGQVQAFLSNEFSEGLLLFGTNEEVPTE